MNELTEPFLSEVKSEFDKIEPFLSMIKKDPSLPECWDALNKFFESVRSVALFAEFPRCHALSVSAIEEIDGYLNKTLPLDVLPSVLMKFQRIRKICSSANNLKREPRESDEDLLSKSAKTKKIKESSEDDVVLESKKKVVLEQEKKLDEREEQLVQWAQKLYNRENDLQQRESSLFKNEQSNADTHKKMLEEHSKIEIEHAKLDERQLAIEELERQNEETRKNLDGQKSVVADLRKAIQGLKNEKEEWDFRLSKKDKLIAELEDELAGSRLSVDRMSEQLKERDHQQLEISNLLETKNKSIREVTESVCQLEERLLKVSNQATVTENELRAEVSMTKQQLRQKEEELQNLQFELSNLHSNIDKTSSDATTLKKDYDDVLDQYNASKINLEKLQVENIDLEQRCNEMTSQFNALNDEIRDKTIQLKQAQDQLKKQSEHYLNVQSELRAIGWPLEVEHLQQNLGKVLALDEGQSSGAKLQLWNFIRNMRLKPVLVLKSFVQGFAATRAKKYEKNYAISVTFQDIKVDKDCFVTLEHVLASLIDNSIKYANFDDNQTPVLIKISTDQVGTVLKLTYQDNVNNFAYEKIRGNVVEAGLFSVEDAQELTEQQLLDYTFHNKVLANNGTRGLLSIAGSLEQLGGTVKMTAENGMKTVVNIPVNGIYDKAVLFEVLNDTIDTPNRVYSLPMGAVVETFSLKEKDFEELGSLIYHAKTADLPVICLPGVDYTKMQYGIVCQAGAFTFLLPVSRILEPEYVVVNLNDNIENRPYLKQVITLDNNRLTAGIDIPVLLKICPIGVSTNEESIVSEVKENKITPTRNQTNSYMIYNADPHNIEAVLVSDVVRIESFTGASIDGNSGENIYVSQSKTYPLVDSCRKKDFQYAQTVLLFSNFALAVQEVTDIVDVNVEDEETTDFLLYQGRKVPIRTGKEPPKRETRK